MLYYSEKTKKFYQEVAELKDAEKDYDKAQAEVEKKALEKKERAKLVEEAYNRAQEARKAAAEMVRKADQEYYDLRNTFVKDYGSFHMSYIDNDAKVDDVLTALSQTLANWPW